MKRFLTLALVCSLGLFCVGCSSNQDNQIVGGEAGDPAEVAKKNDDYMKKMQEAQAKQAEQQAGGTPSGQ
jgi:hypothetical protein